MSKELDDARRAYAAGEPDRTIALASLASAAALERLVIIAEGSTVPLARGLRSVRIRKED